MVHPVLLHSEDFELKRKVMRLLRLPISSGWSRNDKVIKMNCFWYLFLASQLEKLASMYSELFPYFFNSIR